MKLALPNFQYRFVPKMGNVIHPGNFHPVGVREGAGSLLARASSEASTDAGGGNWIVVGGSGGFGSAARAILGGAHGADTLDVSFDAQPNPDSNNKIRKIGSPGFHRTRALDAGLTAQGRVARSLRGDAFDPTAREAVVDEVRESFGGKINGLVWALATPRATDSRTGKPVSSALRPLGAPVKIKTFSGRDAKGGVEPAVAEIEIPSGTPEEAIRTIFVMGGAVVRRWIDTLLAADVLAEGFTLYTISYRGNPLNEGVYRKGLIGLAKADLEFETAALDHVLRERVGGRALAVEGPAVVTEASGGIPGVPFYMANVLDVLGERFEDPLASMQRLFTSHFGADPVPVDDAGLVRMDDRELEDAVQAELANRFEKATVGDPFDGGLYDRFMTAYAQTRGFEIPGVDYAAEFDTDDFA